MTCTKIYTSAGSKPHTCFGTSHVRESLRALR